MLFTAVIGAFAVNQLLGRDGEKDESLIIKSVIGGLLNNRLANGPTRERTHEEAKVTFKVRV